MKIHHLDCASMRPPSERLVHGVGSWIAKARMVAHCLLVESEDGLVLIDSGFGLDDVTHAAERLGKAFLTLTNPALDPQQCAVRQVEALGYERSDVRHIVLTHMDIDHAGGLPDFPDARVHVYRREHAAALRPKGLLKLRYRPAQWAHGPDWVLHETDGERFMGFDSVKAIVEPEVLLVPLLGHSPGHAAVAVRHGDGWLLHCGDAYFNKAEMREPPSCPAGLAFFQRHVAVDNRARLDNQARLRRLHREHDSEIRVFSAHDPDELQAFLN
jgi:glyoxylase-like metal-dependent hydrolase (beta-lactamase superfamily II)